MCRSALRRVVGTALAGVLALGCRDGNPAAVAEVASGRFRAEATGAVRGTLEGDAELLLPLGESMEVELRDAGTQRMIVFAGGGFQTITSFQPFRFRRGEHALGLLTDVFTMFSDDPDSQARPYFALRGTLRVTEATDRRVAGTFWWEGSADPRDPSTRIRLEGAFDALRAP
ncbi:MAG TPA: hypothetical protein VF584_03290 [Longimicrobium sp.]